MNYLNESIDQLHQNLVDQKLSAKELATNTLDNIKKTDDKFNSFISLNENAPKEAEAITEFDTPLAGIPIAVKDNIVTTEMKTTAASRMLENFVSVYDATVVSKLKDQKAVIIGKPNLDEFAMGSSTETSYFGVSKNPWDHTKVPGGSSGGSATAVASGQVVAALGSDTGGSIRQPSAFTGIFGIKPTYGRVSRWGLIAFSSSLDQIGVMTKRVKDAAYVLNAISGHDERDSTSSMREVPDFTKALNKDVKGLKIAVPKEYFEIGVSDEVKRVVNEAIKVYEENGAIVEEVSLPHTKYVIPTYYLIASSEASSNLQRFDGIRYGFRASDVKSLADVYVKTRSEGFGDEVKRRIMLGTFSLSAGTYDAYFKKAAQLRTLIKQDFDRLFEKYDLVMGPTAPTTAFGIDAKNDDPMTMYANDILTISANMAGIPAASIPAGLASDNMPVGLQIMAQRFDEEAIFNAASFYEDYSKFYEKVPSEMEDK